MSKKVTGITKNGIEEECRWNKAGSCPRHTIHKGMPNAPVSLPEGLTDEYETSSPMAVFDDADSHIATTKDIREGYSLNEFGEPDSRYEAEFDAWLSEHDRELVSRTIADLESKNVSLFFPRSDSEEKYYQQYSDAIARKWEEMDELQKDIQSGNIKPVVHQRESVLIKQIEEYKAKGWKPVHAEAELDYLQTGMIGASYLEELDLLNEGNNHSQWLKTLQVELVSTGEHDDLYQTVIETPKGEYFKINFSYSRAWDSNHIYTDPVKVFPKQVTVTKYE